MENCFPWTDAFIPAFEGGGQMRTSEDKRGNNQRLYQLWFLLCRVGWKNHFGIFFYSLIRATAWKIDKPSSISHSLTNEKREIGEKGMQKVKLKTNTTFPPWIWVAFPTVHNPCTRGCEVAVIPWSYLKTIMPYTATKMPWLTLRLWIKGTSDA